ncbi:MAG TPA: SAM-dependent chlorinase/fluorinase [Pyrinomonadaceae bacterium]|nr:SAM-dependent chlorinase/fluorinase [Pyrinomonadaceae bacterium]
MIVTLLTDFGTADYFVGAMKGAVLSVNPAAQVLDLTHEVPAHDVEAGAFTLAAAFETFPAGTVHVAVVDPGVGSGRRAVVIEGGGQRFVGPDNGLFGLVYERLGEFRVYHITDRSHFRPHLSSTFHGRDLFAPVAGALSKGLAPRDLGPEVTDFVRLARARPRRLGDGTLEAAVVQVDRFGNCVTNISPRDLRGEAGAARFAVGGREVTGFRRYYAEGADGAADDEGAAPEPFVIWGSAGLLEISVNRGSASRLLGIGRGARVVVRPAR